MMEQREDFGDRFLVSSSRSRDDRIGVSPANGKRLDRSCENFSVPESFLFIRKSL